MVRYFESSNRGLHSWRWVYPNDKLPNKCELSFNNHKRVDECFNLNDLPRKSDATETDGATSSLKEVEEKYQTNTSRMIIIMIDGFDDEPRISHAIEDGLCDIIRNKLSKLQNPNYANYNEKGVKFPSLNSVTIRSHLDKKILGKNVLERKIFISPMTIKTY